MRCFFKLWLKNEKINYDKIEFCSIKNSALEKVENCKDAATISEETGNDQGSEEVDFKDMKVSELETYASEHGIDLTGAKTKEEKIALIKANESN